MSIIISCPLPDVKNVTSTHGRDVNIVAGLMEEDFEVADDGKGSLPSLPHSARFGFLDPTFTRCSHTVVDINAKRKLSCGQMYMYIQS